MLSGARYLLSDVAYWIRSHPVRGALAVLGGGALIAAAAYGISQLVEDDADRPLAPAPEVIVRTEEPAEEPAELGFPAFATSNTTRVAGADPIADAVGVALATFPRGGPVEGPDAVALAPVDDWAAGVAAAALVREPIGAPVLLTDGSDLPELTAGAIASLAPQGSADTGNRQAFVIGDAPEPSGLRTTRVEGANAPEVAAAVARLRERLTDSEPEHILIASADDPAFAMPAAAWAARSGDPVLFAQRNSVPDATVELLERWADVPVYILGDGDVISRRAERRITRASDASVRRAAEGSDPVANSISFARYVDGTFGWNINDPGHGLVIANAERPADAGAAAALSGSGSWGPLLVTDDAEDLPPDLEGYLLDLKPGYDDDPTRAVYNHVWIIGDENAIAVDFQVTVDEIAEVAPVRSGAGESILGPPPGTPEAEGPRRGNQGNQTR